ncbi:MAG: NAD-dependent epimerase/dehydratase family protein [Phaeodactylibacter sp.]|nr:NAD-dependent epimerase/dehydratase family protein [Phaeodactylibacter sp.]MCB0616552.1 NAD-dependent epimerase/dehydratase family protein [Phaeodactylibacter sp.]
MEGPVLVTGANGFIGRRLTRRLLAEGLEVHALVLPNEPVPIDWEGEVVVHRGDITGREAILALARGKKKIFHLAAVVSDWGPEPLYQQVTVDGTRNILDAAVKEGAQIILVSSIAVYGDQLQGEHCHEELGHGQTFGPYSRAKQAQEVMARAYMASRGLPAIIIRPANVYGPGCRPWVHELILAMQQWPVLIGNGNNNAGLVYVDNLVELMVLAANTPKAIGHVYNAAEDNPTNWKQYTTDLAKLAGIAPPRSVAPWIARLLAALMEKIWKWLGVKSRPHLTKEALNLVTANYDIPIHKARQELGYEPVVPYEEGMKHIEDYFRSLG